jgi:4-hydroxybenzoate polyprenyltransferase
VTRLPRLYLVLLRYRVAAMVAMFTLLGAARADGLTALSVRHALALLALASSYVAATALNDLADEAIDRVNHPSDAGRPLVEGTATRRELHVLHVLAGATALGAALPLGLRGVAIVASALLISIAYSARPLLLSYRTSLAHVVLAVAYVLIPFGLGAVAGGGSLAADDAVFAAGLFCLFLARIVLKDFRDRRGDALYGKPTLLLRRGKTATCATSLAALLAGDALVCLTVEPALAVVLQLFVGAVAWMLGRLYAAETGRAEQVAIGIGARVGNGLLLTALGWLALAAHGAPRSDRLAFALLFTAVFGASYASLAARPDQVVLGYKG